MTVVFLNISVLADQMHRATLSTTEILLDESKHEATIQGRTVGITKSNEECFWSQTAATQQPELTNSSDYAIRFTNFHRFIVFRGIMHALLLLESKHQCPQNE